MNRRRALQYTLAMTGVTLSASFVSNFLIGCKTEPIKENYKPQLLPMNLYSFLESLSDIIIPKTETPGALELGVAQLIDGFMNAIYSKKDQAEFLDQFTKLFTFFAGKGFEELGREERTNLVHELEKSPEDLMLLPIYKNIKGMIAANYLSTEYVIKEVLNYLPVPEEYEPCIPLNTTNGKAWAI